MKYSYEYKIMCVDMYRRGERPETPEWTTDKHFHGLIRECVRKEDCNDSEVLKHKNANRVWTAGEKYELVARVIAGASYRSIAISAGIEYSSFEVFSMAVAEYIDYYNRRIQSKTKWMPPSKYREASMMQN